MHTYIYIYAQISHANTQLYHSLYLRFCYFKLKYHTSTPVWLCKLSRNGRRFFRVEGSIHNLLNLLKGGSTGRLGKASAEDQQ